MAREYEEVRVSESSGLGRDLLLSADARHLFASDHTHVRRGIGVWGRNGKRMSKGFIER